MKHFKRILFFIPFIAIAWVASAQNHSPEFTHADSLLGGNGPGRSWWDVTTYDLNVQFDINHQAIAGSNTIHFKTLAHGDRMQIDLQEPLVIDSISWAKLPVKKNSLKTASSSIVLHANQIIKEGNAWFISTQHQFDDTKKEHALTIYYHGQPHAAHNAPWDGGFVWKTDQQNRPWVSVACQDDGASIWYPCKDLQSDEPDRARMAFTCPDSLTCVSNGRLDTIIQNNNGTKTFVWQVSNPINNYCIVPYIGKYAHFSEKYKGEKGDLDMDYWVLDYNLEKARVQFKEATRMLKAFEYWMGPYPFYADGYKLVDAPYVGMEHQSAVAYGNHYKMGYDGIDRSATGWGFKWDFIIVHESGHEWFANNITSKDIADMWIHEAFTNYSETLFTEYYYGKKAAAEYIVGERRNIQNDRPIIGPYNVHQAGSTDMYDKGGNLIHLIRLVINNDKTFRKILRGLNKDFYHQTVSSAQVEAYINHKSGFDFSKIFDQYLRTTQIPVLEYKIMNYSLSFRYSHCVTGFNLPLKVSFKGERWIRPTEQWQTISFYPEGDTAFQVSPEFYIRTQQIEQKN